MTPQPRAQARDLRKVVGGSLEAHESLEEAVLRLLALRHVPARAIHAGPRVAPVGGGTWRLRGNPGQRGFSDVLACLPPSGRTALFELKTGGAHRSPDQVRFHREFRAAGAVCLTIRTVTEVLACLDAAERAPREQWMAIKEDRPR